MVDIEAFPIFTNELSQTRHLLHYFTGRNSTLIEYSISMESFIRLLKAPVVEYNLPAIQ